VFYVDDAASVTFMTRRLAVSATGMQSIMGCIAGREYKKLAKTKQDFAWPARGMTYNRAPLLPTYSCLVFCSGRIVMRFLLCTVICVCFGLVSQDSFGQFRFRQPNWSITGPGGGGALYCPSINPHDDSEIYIASDMGQVFHSISRGDRWKTIDHRKLRGFQNSRVEFTSSPAVRYVIDHSLEDISKPKIVRSS
jgi:hypothetical protein